MTDNTISSKDTFQDPEYQLTNNIPGKDGMIKRYEAYNANLEPRSDGRIVMYADHTAAIAAMANNRPTVVIFVEDGQVQYVQSDVDFHVMLVDYDCFEADNMYKIESAYGAEADYVGIDILDANVDKEAVDSLWEIYIKGPEGTPDNEDGGDGGDDDSPMIRPIKG